MKLWGLRRRAAIVALGVTGAGVTLGLSQTTLFETYELATYDARMHFAASGSLHEDLFLVEIDHNTIKPDALGWPVPREYYVKLVDLLTRSGARAVAFDVLFHDDQGTYDRLLAYAADRQGRVSFGASFVPVADPAHSTEQPPPAEPADLLPVEALRHRMAHTMILADVDKIARRVPPLLGTPDGRTVPALSLSPFLSIGDGAWKTPASDGGSITIEDVCGPGCARTIPLDAYGAALIRFETVTPKARMSMFDLLRVEEEQGDLSFLKDRIVLVGQTAQTIGDHVPTPLDTPEIRSTPGLYLHANFVDNLLRGRFIRRADTGVRVATLFALALLTAIFTGWLRTGFSLMAFSILTSGYAAASYLLFARIGLWIDLFAPLVSITVCFGSLSVFNHFTRDRAARIYRVAFASYVAPHILDQILEDPAVLSVRGDLRELSVLFSDIKGYTHLSNTLEPAAVMDLLREYLDRMVEVVMRHEGMVDKIMGDGIMVLFGAPVATDEHAKHAVHAAIAMQQEVERLQKKWESEGKVGLSMRVGVATGEAYVGNIGSSSHLEYTAIGQVVNLASRLEGQARPGGVLVNSDCRKAVGDAVEFREVTGLTLKGYDEEVRAFEVLSVFRG